MSSEESERTQSPISIRNTRVQREMNEQKRLRNQHDKQHKSQLFAELYGDRDIMNRISDLATRPIYNPPHEGPIDKINNSPILPIQSLKFDDHTYNISGANSARTPHKSSKRLTKESGIQDIQSYRAEPVAKLVVPSSRKRYERPSYTAKLRKERAQSFVEKQENGSSPMFKLQNQVKEEKIKPDESSMRKNSLLSLHYFDDASYDSLIMDKLIEELKHKPVLGYTMYTFDRETLVWQKCQVVDYKDPFFIIKWDKKEKTKEVYRISLKFEFDDPMRFEIRRRKAFVARAKVEKELKLFAYIQSLPPGPPPQASILDDILNLLPPQYKILPRIKDLMQEVIGTYEFSEHLALYILECKDPEKLSEYKEKGFPILELHKPNYLPSSHLRSISIKRPPHKPLIKMQEILFDIRSTPLYDSPLNKMDTLVELEDFISSNDKILKECVLKISKIDITFYLGKTQEMLPEDREPDWTSSLLKMADLWFTDNLVDTTINSLQGFIEEISQKCIFFPISYDNTFHIIGPTRETLISEGDGLLYKIKIALDDVVKSCLFLIDKESNMKLDYSVIDPIFNKAIEDWHYLVNTACDQMDTALEDIRQIISPIPLGNIEEFLQIDQNSIDLDSLEEKVKEADRALTLLKDSYQEQIDFGFIHVDLSENFRFTEKQYEEMREFICTSTTQAAFKMIKKVDDSTAALRLRCQHDSETIEEFYEKNVLLSDLKANFKDINTDIDSTFSLFDFLDIFYYDKQINISEAYKLKVELRLILDALPRFQEQGKIDYKKLLKDHMTEISQIQADIEALNEGLSKYPLIIDYEEAAKHTQDLDNLLQEFISIKERASLSKSRDQKMNIDITDFELINPIEIKLNNFIDFWRIALLLQTDIEHSMSVMFLELMPDEILENVREWKKKLTEINDFFINPRIAPEGNPCVLELGEKMMVIIDDILSHIPIIQYLCNPTLRNRHWSQITDVTGYNINPNEGLTWHWIIESTIEKNITEIASIAKTAQMEFKIEKALKEMMMELRSKSVALTPSPSGTYAKIDDPMPIFNMLAEQQRAIQEVFVPPFNKPFIMQMKEYESLTQSIRQLVTKAMNAQASMDKISPAMESEDVKTQSTDVADNYEDALNTFNRLIHKFGQSSSFFEMISNPKYIEVADSLTNDLIVLKENLDKILAEKRKAYPYFCLLSDYQLIQVLAHSSDPENVKELFGYIFADVKYPIFQNHKCKGFVGTNNEEFIFAAPFNITPESIEQLFTNFENAIKNTIRIHLFDMFSNGSITPQRIPPHIPSQVASIFAEISFNRTIEKIFEAGTTILDEGKKKNMIDSQMDQLLANIENDITAISKRARDDPSPVTMNMAAASSKHLEIVKELIDKEAYDNQAYSWIKRFRYQADPANQTVTIAAGPYTYPYDFSYAGDFPVRYFDDDIENMYSSLLVFMVTNFNPLLTGPCNSSKIDLLNDFARKLGKNRFILSCSSSITPEIFTKFINIANATNLFLIMSDLRNLDTSVLINIPKQLLNTSRKESKKNPVLFGTYSLPENEKLPSHMSLLFREITLRPLSYQKVIKAALAGVGYIDDIDLETRLLNLLHCYLIDTDQRISRFYSVKNILNILVEKPIDPENPIVDIFMRVDNKLDRTIDPNNEIHDQILKIFSIKETCRSDTDLNLDISEDEIINSGVLLEKCREFMQMLHYNRNVAIVGDEFSGKTSLIKFAAKYQKAHVSYINPYIQDFAYLYGSRSDGILYNEIHADLDNKWVVFDSKLEDKWMNIISLTENVHFSDGSHLILPNSFKYIFETDSISYLTPATVSKISIVVIPENAIGIEQFLKNFENSLMQDSRFIEPTTLTIVGTKIPAEHFFQYCRDFITFLIPKLVAKDDIFNPRYMISNFFRIFTSIFTVHYCSNIQLSAFNQQSRDCIIEQLVDHCIFSAIWAIGSLYIDDQRNQFQAKFRSIFEEQTKYVLNDVLKNNSIFEYYYDGSTKSWVSWEDLGTNSFFSASTSSVDVAPEFLLLPSNMMISTLYLCDCLHSQNQKVFLESSSTLVKNVLIRLGTNTTYMASHFSPQILQSPSDQQESALRNIIDDSLSGVRDGSRPMIRIPLISFQAVDPKIDSFTELIRFADDYSYITNLQTFLYEYTKGLSFFMSGTFDVNNLNKRMLDKFTVIRIPHFHEKAQYKGVKRMVDYLLGISHSEEIASAILNTTKELNSCFKFNIRHIMKYIQRVSIVLQHKELDFLTEAFASEAMASYYDPDKSEEVLAKLNILIRTISKIFNQPAVNLFEQTNLLTNIQSDSFYYVSCIEDIKSENPRSSSKIESRPISIQKSMVALLNPTNVQGRFTDVYDLSKIDIPTIEYSIEEQRDVLRLSRHFTTPRTHTLISCPFNSLAKQLVQRTTKLLGIQLTILESGMNFLKSVHDTYIEAGQTLQHQVILLNEKFLSQSDISLTYQIITDPSVYGLLKPKEMLNILTDLKQNTGDDDDPFKEETLESKSNYNSICRDFLRNCNQYFHICVITTNSSQYFTKFEKYCSPFTLDISLESVLANKIAKRLSDLEQGCFFDNEKTYDLVTSLIKIKHLENCSHELIVSCIKNGLQFFKTQYNENISLFNEKFQKLTELNEIFIKTQTKMDNTVKAQERMEKEIDILTKEIDLLVAQCEVAEKEARNQHKIIEAEEKILKQEEQTTAALQKESEESLNQTKSLLDKSTAEIRSLSPRDLSVIKSMNHPPKGVFLVVKSLIVIMGGKIEDKDDLENGMQPSWIAGKKSLSDPSFLPKLLQHSLNSLNQATVNALKPFLDDPNFRPEIVEASSTAAKSICNFIRAIVPYFFANIVFEEKQKQLSENQKKLRQLEDQHADAMKRLEATDKNLTDIQNKSKLNLVKKQNTEDSLQASREAMKQYQTTMNLMVDFFNRWKDELGKISEEKKSIDYKWMFIGICFGMFGQFDVKDREEIFNEVQEVFKQKEYPVLTSRADLTDFYLDSMTQLNKLRAHGATIPYEHCENIVLIMMNPTKWFYLRDPDLVSYPILKSLIKKRITVLSFKSTEFEYELLDSIGRNDFTLITDYSDHSQALFFNLFRVRGTTIELKGAQHEVPEDFQVAFIVNDKPSNLGLYDSVYVDFSVTSNFLCTKIASLLFGCYDPDNSNECEALSKSITDATLELQKSQIDLIEYVLENRDDLLNDVIAIKNFHNAKGTYQRVGTHLTKTQQKYDELKTTFTQFLEKAKPFVELFSQQNLGGGPIRYTEIIEQEVSMIDRSEGINKLLENVKLNMIRNKVLNLDFNQRVTFFVKQFGIKYDNFDKLLKNIESIAPGILITPSSPENLIRLSSNRRPIVLNVSYSIYRYLANIDKLCISSIKDTLANFSNALNLGKMLMVLVPEVELTKYLLSTISRIYSATSISNDFRLIIFTDADLQSYQSVLINYCDFINMNGHSNIRHNLSMTVPTVPFSVFETTKPGQSNYWRRFVVLIAMFDAITNAISQNIFDAVPYDESNFDIVTQIMRAIENQQSLGEYAINTIYRIPELLELWKTIFTKQNLEPANIQMKLRYIFPSQFTLTSFESCVENYPLIDDPEIYNFPSKSYDARNEAFLKRLRQGDIDDVDSSTINPVDKRIVHKFLIHEVDFINTMIQKNKKVPQNISQLAKMISSKFPQIDISLLTYPMKFFQEALVQTAISNNRSSESYVFAAVTENLDLDLKNIVLLNASLDKTGKIVQNPGANHLDKFGLKIVPKEEGMIPIPFIFSGVHIMQFYVKADVQPTGVFFISFK